MPRLRLEIYFNTDSQFTQMKIILSQISGDMSAEKHSWLFGTIKSLILIAYDGTMITVRVKTIRTFPELGSNAL